MAIIDVVINFTDTFKVLWQKKRSEINSFSLCEFKHDPHYTIMYPHKRIDEITHIITTDMRLGCAQMVINDKI